MSRALFHATLTAIGRVEARGDRPQRLTEPDHARWQHFRRQLTQRDFIELLHQDAAQTWPVPFDLAHWPEPCVVPEEAEAERLIEACCGARSTESVDWLRAYAAEVGLPGGALSDAPAFNPRDKILDLSGGRIAAYRCLKDPTLDMARQFTFIAQTNAEWVCVGLAAVEAKAAVTVEQVKSVDPLTLDPGAFTRVVGLRAGVSEAVVTHFGEAARWV
ncbi:MAG: hypothetical protein ACE366_20120 [Bradymonadia bacterium]